MTVIKRELPLHTFSGVNIRTTIHGLLVDQVRTDIQMTGFSWLDYLQLDYLQVAGSFSGWRASYLRTERAAPSVTMETLYFRQPMKWGVEVKPF